MITAGKERNRNVDCLRGIAILLVVLGHTVSGSTSNYESTALFNVIWSLQMPLFMLISGYVNKYRRRIDSGKTFGVFVLKTTMAYLLPFFVWTFLVRGAILHQQGFLDVKYLVWHMDAGYWFLFSLWTITLFFGFSLFISHFVKSAKKVLEFLVTGLVFGVLIAVLLVLGRMIGMSFLGIKFTVYYSIFYFAGYTYGSFQEEIWNRRILKNCVQVFVAVCWVVWVLILARVNTYLLPDGGIQVIWRAGASFAGCIAICGTVSSIPKENKVGGGLSYCGFHSLEIYLIHSLFLNIIADEVVPSVSSLAGFLMIVLNYVVTLSSSLLVAYLLNSNMVTRFLTFGKTGSNMAYVFSPLKEEKD